MDRLELEGALRRWQDRREHPADLKKWVEGVTSDTDPVVREVLAELDLLEVFLLTPEDVPALLALLQSPSLELGLPPWRDYKDRIDLDARSKSLKKDPFYKPFCR